MTFDLNFSFNWNNKLDCNAFTTLRLFQPEKHKAGHRVNISLKGKEIAKGRIEAVRPLYLHQVNEYMAYIDTGYNRAECMNIIKRMYSKVDFEKTQLVLLLIVKEK